MKKYIRILIFIALACLFVIAPQPELQSNVGTVDFVIIFPGGPDTQQEGTSMISQFISNLVKLTGLSKSQLRGKYFNNINLARTYIKTHRNSFIMGSLGFFLAHKSNMGLVPLATVNLGSSNKERYYLVVKKGRYGSLNQLKGKTLSGNVIFETKNYINNIVFNDSIDVSKHFLLKPTSRPLSAVRRLTRKRIDAVLLNKMQYESLKSLALFSKIEVIYKSNEVPALGLMMVNNSRTKSVKDKVLNAVTTMCNLADTKEVCKNFGLSGFLRVKPGELDEVTRKYNN